MPSLDGAKIESTYNLFVGTPGTRKSTQALSYPKPQFWLSYDQKMKALIKPMRDWKINPKDVTYEDYSNWDNGRQKLEQFQLSCPYKTIVIDSITSMAISALKQVKDAKGTTGKKIAGIQVNSIEDYNAESAALMELLSLTKTIYKSHNVFIILIAHLIQAEYKTPGGASNVVRTIVTAGKRVAPMIPALADETYHFYLENAIAADQEGDYSILTSSTSEDFARTALPLERKINFGNQPLYDTWIKPAMDKINS